MCSSDNSLAIWNSLFFKKSIPAEISKQIGVEFFSNPFRCFIKDSSSWFFSYTFIDSCRKNFRGCSGYSSRNSFVDSLRNLDFLLECLQKFVLEFLERSLHEFFCTFPLGLLSGVSSEIHSDNSHDIFLGGPPERFFRSSSDISPGWGLIFFQIWFQCLLLNVPPKIPPGKLSKRFLSTYSLRHFSRNYL